jgi:manganese/zinc/iron transport system substrate-binding protein
MSSSTAAAAALLALLFSAGCGGGSGDGAAAPSGGPLRVLATTGMIAEVAGRVAGPYAAVDSLMGPGVDPHLFEASESDVRRLAEADLILYTGLHLEGGISDLLADLARTRPVVAVSGEIPADRLLEPPGLAGRPDPHVWLDVSLWQTTLEPIVRELTALDPHHRAELRANADRVGTELAELDAWVASRIAELPEARRVLVTAHDGFGYFGRRYGVDVVGLRGTGTGTEPSPDDVDRVAGLVAARKVPAVFTDSSLPGHSIEAVQAAAHARGHEVRIGGELYADALGPPGSPEGTYEGMIRHDVDTLVDALSRDSP